MPFTVGEVLGERYLAATSVYTTASGVVVIYGPLIATVGNILAYYSDDARTACYTCQRQTQYRTVFEDLSGHITRVDAMCSFCQDVHMDLSPDLDAEAVTEILVTTAASRLKVGVPSLKVALKAQTAGNARIFAKAVEVLRDAGMLVWPETPLATLPRVAGDETDADRATEAALAEMADLGVAIKLA